MKRLVFALMAAALPFALATPAHALGSAANSNGYWGCVVSHELDLSACVEDPIPEVPGRPDVRNLHLPSLAGLPV